LYDIEQFRYKYVGLCAGIKILALAIFITDWWLIRRRRQLDETGGITANEIVGSIISLDKLFEEKPHTTGHRRNLSSVSAYEIPASPNPSTSGLRLSPTNNAIPTSPETQRNGSFKKQRSDSNQEDQKESQEFNTTCPKSSSGCYNNDVSCSDVNLEEKEAQL